MESPDPTRRFLNACARVELDADSRGHLLDAASQLQDWDAVVDCCEQHGLTPLVHHYVQANGIALPAAASKQLLALVLRHRARSQAQADALGEIVGAFCGAGIDHVILKGAVLAHVIYASPDLRPMGDLDILVAPADTVGAQTLLRRLGFDVPAVHGRRTLRFHHHLPAATRQRDGALVTVEIHTDALSPDEPGTLRLERLSQPPRELVLPRWTLRAFGHVDMLVHLSWHVLEPRDRTRLIAVADLVGYAARHASEIDWDFMRTRHPRVVNALSLMHYVTPLPEPLRTMRPPEALGPPGGVGRGFIPLGSAFVRGRDPRVALRQLLYPPEWWMRAYYGVPVGRPLTAVHRSRHLYRLSYWIGRRLLASSVPSGGSRFQDST
jgi:hypothetical protein